MNYNFAHPFHLWECGTNENKNILIHEYLSKKGTVQGNITTKAWWK